ncbi:hypothetical protein GCM10007860_18720 [Chitiniphilus shinanonensis]|uniref:Uncharacterized protein n=1 Tax=Chitiniphilus shinanonensis TaxID=553088 RepID=A0ABQ6BRU8_9NEIS|nr:hypothetical protein [Chitiniphilus shinanonensis]GLS04725.1 hypothetical protein GCM10007860_18720 [Chitiniphilus shinanonensis]
MATIYHKTELGQQELVSRSGQVPPKARQLLIMVDGRRSFDDLTALMPGAAEVIRLLEQLKLITPEGAPRSADTPVVHGAYDKLPSSERLYQVKRAVLLVAREYLGEGWESRLSGRFDTLREGPELEALIEEWLTALRRSGHRGAADTGQRAVATILAS